MQAPADPWIGGGLSSKDMTFDRTEAASRLDTRFADYTGFRLTLACPPTGSIFTIAWPLAIREG